PALYEEAVRMAARMSRRALASTAVENQLCHFCVVAEAMASDEQPQPHRVQALARLYLQSRVNLVLSGPQRNAEAQLAWDPATGKAAVHPWPLNLYGAIYVQFAQAIAADRDFRQCAACGKWMELAPRLNRADRVMCSAACRQKVYRERQERAR